MITPTCAGANNAAAMGTPLARLFFDPHMTSVISSALAKPATCAVLRVRNRTTDRTRALKSSMVAMSNPDTRCQIPSTTAALKAVYTTSRIAPRSSLERMALFRSIQRPMSGRLKWPIRKGASKVRMIDCITPSRSPPPDWSSDRIKRPASSGVMKTPSILDSEAVQTAAATFPLAMDVKAIDDWTVEGNMVRNRKPILTVGLTMEFGSVLTSRPRAGNKPKVLISTSEWSLQAPIPPRRASRESLAPCKKNKRKIATFVSHSNPMAIFPRHGRMLAVTTTDNRISA